MNQVDFIGRKVSYVKKDVDALFDITKSNASVFNRWSAKTNDRLRRLEKRTKFWHFIVLGLLIEDIRVRYSVYQKISKIKKAEQENSENSENSEENS